MQTGIRPQNSPENVQLPGVIGNLDDYVRLPYTFGLNTLMAHLNTNYYHIHGQFITYPDHANSIELTSAEGVWAIPTNTIEIIPENILNSAFFDLHWISVHSISANCELQIDLFAGNVGAEIRIEASRATRNAVQSQEGSLRIQVPQQLAGTRISAKLSDNTPGVITCKVFLKGHYYA